MFDKTVIAKSSKTINNISVTPEKIDLNIKKSDEKSFFIEIHRNDPRYRKLMGEKPVIVEKQWIPWRGGDFAYDWERMAKMMGGQHIETDVPVKVLAIQYSGNGNFIFEIIKLTP